MNCSRRLSALFATVAPVCPFTLVTAADATLLNLIQSALDKKPPFILLANGALSVIVPPNDTDAALKAGLVPAVPRERFMDEFDGNSKDLKVLFRISQENKFEGNLQFVTALKTNLMQQMVNAPFSVFR